MKKCQKGYICETNSAPRSGYVLISVLVIMMIMVAITYFFADALFSELAIARNQKAATICFHLAEAGVQEAIWRIQNKTDIRNAFLEGDCDSGLCDFHHDDPALLPGGSYEVTIQNTAEAAADISATGFYKIGLKTARRRIVVSVVKATEPPPYDYNGAIFSGGSQGEEDITLTVITLEVTGDALVDHDNNPLTPEVLMPVASLISNRDIWFTLSDIDVAKDILAYRNIRNVLSDVTVGGEIHANTGEHYPMTALTLDDLESYKEQAEDQFQYFTAKEFRDLWKTHSSLTFDGVVYVAGGLEVDWWHSLTINGILIAEQSIDIGGPFRRGDLTINHSEGEPSGVITLAKFTAWANSVIDIEGLVYVGDRFTADPWYNINPLSKEINIKGGVLGRRFEANGLRIIKIEFDKDLINEALPSNPGQTPVIETQHWEEEY